MTRNRSRLAILTGLTIFSALIVTGLVSRGHTAAPAPASTPTAPAKPAASGTACVAAIVGQMTRHDDNAAKPAACRGFSDPQLTAFALQAMADLAG